MGFYELLTIGFVVLKLMGIMNCSWWVVFAPMIFKLIIQVILAVIIGWKL